MINILPASKPAPNKIKEGAVQQKKITNPKNVVNAQEDGVFPEILDPTDPKFHIMPESGMKIDEPSSDVSSQPR